jgi:hypothetical protein
VASRDVCNAAAGAKTRFYVVNSAQHPTGLQRLGDRIRALPSMPMSHRLRCRRQPAWRWRLAWGPALFKAAWPVGIWPCARLSASGGPGLPLTGPQQASPFQPGAADRHRRLARRP